MLFIEEFPLYTINNVKGEISVHKTDLSPPFLIEAHIPSQENERSYVRVLVALTLPLFLRFSTGFWNCSQQCGIVCYLLFHFKYFIDKSVNLGLAKICKDEKVLFIRSYKRFFYSNGIMKRDLFAIRDGGLHLNEPGLFQFKLALIHVISHW